MATFGFVAGTLVHTDKGLVPIEQIKVGDRVLSKHESGTGENAYKAVTRTFKSQEKQPITLVKFFINSTYYAHKTVYTISDEGLIHSNEMGHTHYLFCTLDQPFWATIKRWVCATKLILPDQFVTVDGEAATFCSANDEFPPSTPLMQATEIPDVAIYLSHYLRNAPQILAVLVDFRAGRPQLVSSEQLKNLSARDGFHPDEDILRLSDELDAPELQEYYDITRPPYMACEDFPAYHAYVLNLEVEDYHTYYVGKDGIWVHALP